MDKRFFQIIQFIQQSRNNAIKAVNVELINLYWNVGAYIKQKLSLAEWGDKTVVELADYIQRNNPELKGFNRRGLYRMIQFYETYSSLVFWNSKKDNKLIQSVDNQENIIVSPVETQFKVCDIRNTLLVELSWTNHLIIFSSCKTDEEREFYVRQCIKENYSKRELERQIAASLFERVMVGNLKLSGSKQSNSANIINTLKDNYVFEFLNLPESHSENELQKALLKQMKNFILELGKDFLFINQEYKIQVGNSDFYIDLLFYHRGLQCLVAFELKAEKFKPEYLGKLNFYLEALDRDVKKDNENPSLGILLCTSHDSEVVEYSLSRTLSPAMIAEYQTQLPDKKILQQKLHEMYENSVGGE